MRALQVSSGEPMIVTENLTKCFDEFTAVRELTLHVAEGQLIGLLGPNGAGKTTTVRMLAAILKPTAGWARVAGYDVVQHPREVRQAVGLLTEFHGLYLRMRAQEYLGFFADLHGMDRRVSRERIEQLLCRFELCDVRDKRLGEYSKGMRQKVALIRAMVHNPRVLFLDEPTSAMDPHSAKLVRDCIAGLKRDGRTVFMCTHNLAEAEQLADRIAIIRRGRIVAEGTPSELKLRLLGQPLLEIQFARPLDGLADIVRDMVEVESSGEQWIRYRVADPMVANPALVARLAAAGAQVVTVTEVQHSLEEVYLSIVEE
jgi:ABC-2 type transport system ATP-binding protein